MGYKPSDIFILAPSVKSAKSPVRQLENKIKRELPDVMIYVPTNDDEKLDEELLEGKLIFSTFHQTKGLERKVVIIFNFDSSYFKFYKKDLNPCICANELYVATTRGIEHLTLLHHCQNEYLHFIDKQKLRIYCDFEDMRIHLSSHQKQCENIKTDVTDTVKFLPQSVIDECFNQLEIIPNNEYITSNIVIPLKILNDKTTESVSELTGLAIPSMFEIKLKNKLSIFEKLIQCEFESKVINTKIGKCLLATHDTPSNKKYNLNNINISTLTPAELLYISNCWNTDKNGYLFKIYQITNYDWLSQSKLDECMKRMTNVNISLSSEFEYFVSTENEKELLNRKLNGYIDCIDTENNIVYEFKCVQELKKEHYLQLAIYMYMYESEKMKQITKLKDPLNNKDRMTSQSMLELLKDKEQLNKKILECNNPTIIYTKPTHYSIGDIIKFKIFDEDTGTIVKIYKTNGKIKVKNSLNKNIDISITQILPVKTQIEIDDTVVSRLTNELLDINRLIDETTRKELIHIKNTTDAEIAQYKKTTKYVLFNILTNEYIQINCEFQKLKKMVEYLIYSKYINNKPITDAEFIRANKQVHTLCFGEK